MKIATGMVKFAGALGLVLGSLGALAADQALDVVTLKDGRVLQGEIVAEKSGQVQILVDGVARTYDRDFIKQIHYGGDEDEPFATQTAPAALLNGDVLTADLAARYQVPESSVIWVRQQGIPDSDLPEVLAVAAHAGVSLRAVTDLRLNGWSWRSIRVHFGLAEPETRPEVVVEADPVPLFLRILLFPLFFFGWHGYWWWR